MNKENRVLVGMSGGVDSSAVCIMLQEQGYEVVGLTMRVWDTFSSKDIEVATSVRETLRDGSPISNEVEVNQCELECESNGKPWPDYIREAKNLAKRLGIAHYVADEREAFRRTIVQGFVDEYMQGRTPNPCVLCNPLFKFRILTEWANRLGCAHIATGHYIRLQHATSGYTYILTGDDPAKDQSYFLWRVGQEVLQHAIFPLGELTKTEVRDYLSSRGYKAKSTESESMEVCFVDGDYRDFLRVHCPDIDARIGPGKFVDASGITLGTHRGYPYYTIGQRKGLEIALGRPAYVLKLNPAKNTVMLGSAEELLTCWMLTEAPLLVDEQEFFSTENLTVRIRYRSRPIPCVVRLLDDGRLLVRFKTPASAITPGQSAVFYIGSRLVGGAFIASQRGIGMWITE